MSRPVRLRCRECGVGGPDRGVQYCDACFGPLEVEYGERHVTREAIEAGPPSLWRYRPLLPFDGGLPAGWTPLVRAERLGAELGLDEVWLKVEGANPTGSFKDRLVATAVAASAGAEVLACASTGNLGRAVLRSASLIERDAVVLVPAGTGVDGAIEVAGGYDALNRLSVEAAMVHDDWAWVNVGRCAFYVEGAATIAYEIVEQLGWMAPDHVLAPVASGASLLRMARAFDELRSLGLVDSSSVRISFAQPAGCAAIALGKRVRPSTAATSLAMGDPPDGPDLLAVVRASGGVDEVVPEDEIARGVELLARTEGIATEPAGGVVVSALHHMARAGVVGRDERVVVCLTAGVAGMGAGTLGVPIEPTVEALEAALPEHLRNTG